ncbi:hypothetical protein C1H46_035938 [Malus baccata]|uniref:Uncharacterized protein n=1 Tax=Malus baccata TaxID=106549 RepID=A0A540KWL8_MALBA|nr:hypothetical protein C1H46_035938 [Malus baccata]
MEDIETNSDVNPTKSFLGRSLPKSFSWYRDVKMARNMTMAVTEKQRATREAMAKMLKAGSFSRVGFPLALLMPPGMVVEVAKATVVTRAATTEQDLEVLVNHSPPVLTIVAWVSVKMSFAVLPFLLWRAKKCSGMEFFTNYKLQTTN